MKSNYAFYPPKKNPDSGYINFSANILCGNLRIAGAWDSQRSKTVGVDLLQRAECRKPGVKSHAVKQNLLATRRVTLASEAKTLRATNGNTARWENRRKRSRCSSTRKKLKVEIFRLHM